MSGAPVTVCAVLVSWQADPSLLDAVVHSVLSQVDTLVIVDHGRQAVGFEPWLAQVVAQGVVYLPHLDNPGLAAGFNRGIEYARARGFDFVLLLDQDSLLAVDMVSRLLEAYRALSQHTAIAAVGPQFTDPRNGVQGPFVRFGFPFNHKIAGGPGQHIACDFLISSGCLIPLTILEQVGMMDESLFIDNIDMDWCMRATAQGYTLYGICDAKMRHTIGTRLRLTRWRKRGQIIHPPERLYYSTRNRVLLYRRRHVSWTWITQDLLRLIAKFIWMTCLTPPRLVHAQAMLRGVWDGLHGRDRKIPLRECQSR